MKTMEVIGQILLGNDIKNTGGYLKCMIPNEEDMNKWEDCESWC